MTLERIEHKVFASEAPLEEMGQFGSALATTKLNTKDVAEIQALPAYTKGWGSAIISENNYPAMEEMNGVLNVMSYHTGYLYQEGIPVYSANQTYSATSWVKDLAGEKIYKSLQGGNKGHDLTDPAWWEELKLGGGGLEIGDIGFTQMAIDESKGKRRILNGQVIIQDQYVQFTNIIKNSVALNPSLACTEAEWQTAVTMSTNGVCEKFVIDDEAGTIRLPKYPQYLDLTNNTSGTSAKTATVSVKGNGNAIGLTAGTKGAQAVYSLGLRHSGYEAGFQAYTGTGVAGASTAGSFGPTDTFYGLATDASKSGITGSVTIPAIPAVQSERIKGTYFIQVATGAETEDNIINEIELNNPFSLLDYKYSEYELNNISWLHSQGQYNSKAIYPAVYDLLLKIYNGIETKAGVSVKLTTEAFTDYDFVLNTAEETFRLPLSVKQIFWNGINGTFPVVGNGMTLGLTDGTYKVGLRGGSISSGSVLNGSTLVYGDAIGTATNEAQSLNGKTVGVTTDPTKSGIVAQVSQSAVSGLYLYFYVGETVQNANLINAGRIEEKLVDKIDKTGSQTLTINGMSDGSCHERLVYGNYGVMFRNDGNDFYMLLTDEGDAYGTWNDLRPFRINLSSGEVAFDKNTNAKISGYAMPSTRFNNLTLGASGTTYTAPANGYFYIQKKFTGNQYVLLTNTNAGFASGVNMVNGNTCYQYLPCLRGQVIRVDYNAGGATERFIFFYAEGDK